MRKIWKYQVPIQAEPTPILMHRNARILHVHSYGHTVEFWAEVDFEEPQTNRIFYVFGTGWEIPDHTLLHYLGTAVVDRGMDAFVWHLYEVVE